MSGRRPQDRFRDPAQVVALWEPAASVDPALLRYRADAGWWETLARLGITLVASREYEHLLLAFRAGEKGPEVSYLGLPHPSGLAVDRARGTLHVASTRNPNVLLELAPSLGFERRDDAPASAPAAGRWMPQRARFLPGHLYLHDLALAGGELWGNAVGCNSVVQLSYDAPPRIAWWPRCVETRRGPRLGRNHLQLNSIAAGATLADSYFTASSDRVRTRVPGDPRFPVDRQGVVFSGRTREPIVRGLTRPHSARLDRKTLWVANSGYGEVGRVERERFEPAARLGGWTRGLAVCGDVVFAGTSRVLPRFRAYAPGLKLRESRCAIHALHARSGAVLGTLEWPQGDQIFAVEWVKQGIVKGFPFVLGQEGDARAAERVRREFYLFRTGGPPSSPGRTIRR